MPQAMPMDVDKETNVGPIQVTSFTRHDTKEGLLGLQMGGEHPVPTLMVGSDQLTRYVLFKELSPFGKGIILL